MSMFWKTRKRRQANSLTKPVANSGSEISHHEQTDQQDVDLNYLNLEPRRVLSADFSFIGGVLNLDDFSQTADENLTIEEVGGFYQFELSEGTWAGVDTSLVAGNGSNILIANSGTVNDLEVDDTLVIDLDVTFGNVDFSPLGSTAIVTSGNIDQNALSTIAASNISLTANDIELVNAGNDFDSVTFNSTTNTSLADIDRISIASSNANSKIDIHASGIDLTGTVTADQVWLDSSQGMTQTAASAIITSDLLLTGQGSFLPTSLSNDVSNLATDIAGDLELSTRDSLNIGTLTCDGSIYCGLKVTGDLDLDIADGDITQSTDAAVFVGGNALLSAGQGGDICLDGGDCDGDNTNDNLVVGSVRFITSGDVVFAEDDNIIIDSLSGDNFRFIGNNIQFNSNVTANSLLLEASNGVSLNGNTIDVGNLILTGSGNFNLGSTANSIANVAADISGILRLGSNVDVLIGSLVHVSCAGNTQVCGLTIDGDLFVQLDNANLNQNAAVAVNGTTTIDAGMGDICLGGSDCDGDGINDNDFDSIDIVSANEVEIADTNGLTIDRIQANQAAVVAGTSGAGLIRIDGNISVTDQLLLRASDGVGQITGSITANEMLLDGQGDFDLSNLANSINAIAANINGSLEIGNSNDLLIDSLEYDSNCGSLNVATCGLNVGGDLSITLDNADLSQSAAIITTGLTTFDVGTGDVCLSGGDCDGDGINDNDFDSIDVVSANEVEIADSNGLTIERIQANQSALVAGTSGSGQIRIDGNIAVTDQLLLQASNGVNQIGGSVTASELLLDGQGDFAIGNLANSFSAVAAFVTGSLELGVSNDLIIDSLSYASDCSSLSVAICGLNVGGDLSIALDSSDLTQSTGAAVIVAGDALFTTTDGTICLPGGDCNGDGQNDNQIGGTVSVSATGESLIAENDDVTIGMVTGDRFQFIGNNIQISTDITGVDLLLQASDGVSLNGNIIDVTNLILTGEGDFELFNLANSIQNLSADIDGSLNLGSSTDLNVGSLVYASACPANVEVCGVSVSEDLSVTLDNANLDQISAIIVGGLTTIDIGTGDACLELGDCNGDGLNDNDFNMINIVSAREVEIADINDIEIAGLTTTGDAAIIAGQNMPGKIVLDGNVVVNDRLLLQSTNGVDQVSGFVSTNDLILNGQGDFHLCQENQLGSASSAGRVSANVQGELYLQNDNAIELIEQSFTTKSGLTVSHSQFNVSDNLEIVSNGDDTTAIFDSTQINVGGKASFIATGSNADIVADNLNITGAIGVATTDGDATIVNQHSNGIVFRGDDFPSTAATELCAHFENSIVNGDLLAQATGGDITNEAAATLDVNGTATLVAGTTNSANVTGSNNEFNVKVGFATDDNIAFDRLSASARQASMELDDSVQFVDTSIGSPTTIGADDGTLFVTVDGSITQLGGTILSADEMAMTASDFIFLHDIDANRIAFEAHGFLDTTGIAGVPSDLPDDDDDEFAPRLTTVDSEYGVIVSSQNDLTVTTITDALGCQDDLTGISSEQGHAFLQTDSDANISFDGTGNTQTITANGTTFGLAADMQNGHVLTTIADGDLTIEDNTVLVSASGSVTDISTFDTNEGDGFTTVNNEGPEFNLFLPTPSDLPTTKTVNTDDTQFIGINFGRGGEQNFVVQVTWADGVVELLNFNSQNGNRFERFSHTFTNEFLLANFELPTFLEFSNDPAINLFDGSGSTDLNTNENFVLAFSDSRPQGDLAIASVTRPAAVLRESIIPTSGEQVTSETEATEFGPAETTATQEVSDAYLIRLDDSGDEIEDTLQEVEETNVTQDVIAQLKRQVEEGTQYPPAQYRIKWTESGVSFSIEFEKGAEEDLEPEELEPVKNRISVPQGESPEPDSNLSKPEMDGSFSEIEETGSYRNSPPSQLNDDLKSESDSDDDELQIVVEEVSRQSRAGLLMAGVIAIGLRRRKHRQSANPNDSGTDQKELAELGNSISFNKSARTRRKIGG